MDVEGWREEAAAARGKAEQAKEAALRQGHDGLIEAEAWWAQVAEGAELRRVLCLLGAQMAQQWTDQRRLGDLEDAVAELESQELSDRISALE